jgi:hypothetical protein
MPLPDPECGLVISYFYLWSHEREDGLTEAIKAQPCVVLLVRTQGRRHAQDHRRSDDALPTA